LLAFSVIQAVDCVVESEVIEELPMDFPSPEPPEDIPEPIKAEFSKLSRSPDRMYPLKDQASPI